MFGRHSNHDGPDRGRSAPFASALLPTLLLAVPAAAQSGEGASNGGLSGAVEAAGDAASSVATGDLTGAASEAVDALKGADEARLLIADLIGAEVTGPGGQVLGTIEDLVAVPGGTLVAAILAVEGGERLPVPYQLVEASRGADALGVSLPVGLEELRADETVAALASALDL